MTGKQSSAMDKAQAAVESGKLSAQEAAVKFGLSVVSIYRKDWYKAFRKIQRENKEKGDGNETA